MIQTSLECCRGGCPWRRDDRSPVIGLRSAGAGCVRYTAGTVAGVTVVAGTLNKERSHLKSTQKVPDTLRSGTIVTARRVFSTPPAINSSPYPNSNLSPHGLTLPSINLTTPAR